MAHKISITVSDEMKKRLDDYRFGNRIDKFQTAVLDILEAGLIAVENAERIDGSDVKQFYDHEGVIIHDDDRQSV